MSQVYAIGFKHWVELRAYKDPPKAEVDEVVKDSVETRLVGFDINGNAQYMNSPTKFKIRTVHYPKGKVLYTIKSTRLQKYGISVSDQACREIIKAELAQLAERPEYSKLRNYV